MDAKDLQKLGIDANIETWGLLQKQTLTDDDVDQMIATAYASNYLWEKSGLGTKIHQARGHWLISRVMCVAGDAKLAQRHSILCSRYTAEAADREDFDEVYAAEAEARVAAMQHDQNKARALRSKAEAMAATVKDDESREITIGDIKSDPWFDL
jgi:hypothetical protein